MVDQSALWAGTDEGGGIATYIRVMQQTPLWAEWNIRHVVTHRDGSVAAKIWAFARGGALFVFELLRSGPASYTCIPQATPVSFAKESCYGRVGSPPFPLSCTYMGRTSTSITRSHPRWSSR